MIRFGIISEANPSTGRARVQFQEDGIVSGWLPIIQKRTLFDKTMETMDVNEHVVCLMDENCEQGVIIGAIFNDTDTPEGGGADIWARKFKDGTVLKYDRVAKELHATLASGGKVFIVANEINLNGDLIVTGKIEADGEVTAMKDTLNVSLSTHNHPTAPTGPVSPPTPGS